MTITKHGIMRFKQRQKIKNSTEMLRKTECAISRGKLLKNGSTSPNVNCYLFDGFYYLVAGNDDRLVTVFRPKKTTTKKGKKMKLEDIKIKEFISESRYLLASIQGGCYEDFN